MSNRKKYPSQITFQLSGEMYDYIAEEAQRRDVSKAVVAREYADAGRVLVEAYLSKPGLAETVEGIRAALGVSRPDALAALIDLGARAASNRLAAAAGTTSIDRQ